MLGDIKELVLLAREYRLSEATIGFPLPYTIEFARMWTVTQVEAWERGDALHWAVQRSVDQRIWGYAGLTRLDTHRAQAEVRFWVGSGVSRHRVAVEWAKAMIDFAFTHMKLRRVYALQLQRHHSTVRVLSRVGMHQEGLVRKRIHAGGLTEDVACWSILSSRWMDSAYMRRTGLGDQNELP